MSCRFAIVEDSAEERGLYVEYLTSAFRLRCVGAYANAEQALREVPSIRPDVVLMDLGLPGMSGTICSATCSFHHKNPRPSLSRSVETASLATAQRISPRMGRDKNIRVIHVIRGQESPSAISKLRSHAKSAHAAECPKDRPVA